MPIDEFLTGFLTEEFLAPRYLGWLLDGFVVTLLVAAMASVAATLLAMPLCAARDSRLRAVSWPAQAYLSVFRNTPLLVQLFFWYFGASALLPAGWMTWLNSPHMIGPAALGLSWPAFEFIAGLFGLTLYTTAFVAEELRAGLRGVPEGQREAGMALGLSRVQVFLLVIAPQAVRIALPPLLGQYMNALKNSSLTMAIGLAELSYASRQVETETFKTFEAFGVATILYVFAIAVIEVAGRRLQRRASFSQAGA